MWIVLCTIKYKRAQAVWLTEMGINHYMRLFLSLLNDRKMCLSSAELSDKQLTKCI